MVGAPIASDRGTASRCAARHGSQPDLAIEQILILLRLRPQGGEVEAKRMAWDAKPWNVKPWDVRRCDVKPLEVSAGDFKS